MKPETQNRLVAYLAAAAFIYLGLQAFPEARQTIRQAQHNFQSALARIR